MTPSAQIERTLSPEAFLAAEVSDFLQAMGIVTVHLQASPGAGKTCLIMRTIENLGSQLRMAAIQGTLSRQPGPSPLEALDVPTVRVNTRGQSYLDAGMLRESLEQLPLADIDLLLIEEIGTLTCLPEHVLREKLRVVITSLPEGEDCPSRYPEPFAHADAIVLNKLDLLPHLGFDRRRFHQAVRQVNANAPILELSCRTGEGLEAWCHWLMERLELVV